jgi:hypothetical protein
MFFVREIFVYLRLYFILVLTLLFYIHGVYQSKANNEYTSSNLLLR